MSGTLVYETLVGTVREKFFSPSELRCLVQAAGFVRGQNLRIIKKKRGEIHKRNIDVCSFAVNQLNHATLSSGKGGEQ